MRFWRETSRGCPSVATVSNGVYVIGHSQTPSKPQTPLTSTTLGHPSKTCLLVWLKRKKGSNKGKSLCVTGLGCFIDTTPAIHRKHQTEAVFLVFPSLRSSFFYLLFSITLERIQVTELCSFADGLATTLTLPDPTSTKSVDSLRAMSHLNPRVD